MVNTPELNKLSRISEKVQAIHEFLGFARDHYGAALYFYPEHSRFAAFLHKDPDELIMETFGIDPKKVQEERDALIEATRAMSEKNRAAPDQ